MDQPSWYIKLSCIWISLFGEMIPKRSQEKGGLKGRKEIQNKDELPSWPQADGGLSSVIFWEGDAFVHQIITWCYLSGTFELFICVPSGFLGTQATVSRRTLEQKNMGHGQIQCASKLHQILTGYSELEAEIKARVSDAAERLKCSKGGGYHHLKSLFRGLPPYPFLYLLSPSLGGAPYRSYLCYPHIQVRPVLSIFFFDISCRIFPLQFLGCHLALTNLSGVSKWFSEWSPYL